MKAILIIVGIVLLIFAIIQLYAMSSQNSIETYPYKVVKKYDNIEIRNYEARLFSSVQMNTSDYKVASSTGFSKLAGYIFGGNENKEKIAMTSPVTMSLEDSMTMMFMIPKDYNTNNLPKPDQSGISFMEVPAKTLAAIQFGGWADNEKIESYKQKLMEELKKEGILHTNKFFFFGYNPPYEVLNRKNEVLVELENFKL